MRYPASEKLEIINLAAQSKFSVRRTLERLGVSRATFYRWCDQYQRGGPEALHDRPSRPDRVWNKIPDVTRAEIIDLALAEPALSPRVLAVRFIDKKRLFRLGSVGLSAAQIPRSDHQPGFYRHQSRR